MESKDVELNDNEADESEEETSEQEEELRKLAAEAIERAVSPEALEAVGKSLEGIETTADRAIKSREGQDSQDSSRVEDQLEESYAEDDDLSQASQDANEEQRRIGGQGRKGRLVTRQKFWAWVLPSALAAVSLAGSLGVSLLQYFGSGKDPRMAPDELSDDDRKTIEDLVEAWNNSPDDRFFASMAEYVDHWAPSLQAQVLFMGYTKRLAHKASWPKGSGPDVKEMMRKLVSATIAASKPSEIYRTVATLRYALDPMKPTTPVAIPRYLAADLCDLALNQIIKQVRLKGGQ